MFQKLFVLIGFGTLIMSIMVMGEFGLDGTRMLCRSPWCLLGDFHEVLSISEISGGDVSWDYGKQDFLDCATDIHVTELRASGAALTW